MKCVFCCCFNGAVYSLSVLCLYFSVRYIFWLSLRMSAKYYISIQIIKRRLRGVGGPARGLSWPSTPQTPKPFNHTCLLVSTLSIWAFK